MFLPFLKPLCIKILGLCVVVFLFLLFLLFFYQTAFLYINQGTCRGRREAVDEDAGLDHRAPCAGGSGSRVRLG